MAASTSNRLGTQDKKDFEKFTKFLIYKSLQIIVQSRLGEKLKSKSRPVSTGADWFNLAIRDIPEVHSEAKKALSTQQHMLSQNICVDISLRTSEGDCMVLETWYVGFNTALCDSTARVCYTVYNRMGIALKSLFSVSRVTPAYKLSRQQGSCSDDFVICYRIYSGEPQFFQLGDGYKTAKIGAIPGPTGTILINLAYRTKLLISPHKQPKNIQIEVKDDHFTPDSPRRPTTPKPCARGFTRECVGDDLYIMGLEAQDLCSTMFSTSPLDHPRSAPADHPQSSQLDQNGFIPSQPIQINSKSPDRGQDFRKPSSSAPEKHGDFTDHRVGAFAQHKEPREVKHDLEDIPFLSLLDQNIRLETKIADKQIENIKREASSDRSPDRSTSSMHSSTSSRQSAPDDFVMVELKTPFAGTDMSNDLGNFFRECQGAPSLSMFEQEPTISDTICDITNQLSMFETNMKDFDDFVTALNDSD